MVLRTESCLCPVQSVEVQEERGSTGSACHIPEKVEQSEIGKEL